MSAKEIITDLTKTAGVEIDGSAPHDIRVHDERFYDRVLAQQNLGLGESYMEGWWECDDLAEMFRRVLRVERDQLIRARPMTLLTLLPACASARLKDAGSRRHSKNIGEAHYDVGNDLYQKMLDQRMTYTCGYWKDANNLDEAQVAKFELICQKVGLQKGMRVLDIGCGWGSFMKYAAETYGVECVGVTVSREQIVLGEKLCAGLPVTLHYSDYRDLTGQKFDRIISIGMFEHVGPKHYKTFFQKAKELLTDDGLFLLHTIGGQTNKRGVDPWIDRYIFPGGVLPSLANITASFQKEFVMEDWHNFGDDYAKTLRAWYGNVHAAWPELSKNNPKYDERFIRMWEYYLKSCEGSFRARKIHLWQIVLSPKGVEGGYRRVS